MDFVLKRIGLHLEGEIVLDKRCQCYTCGRGKENKIVCISLLVSRRHCIFFHDTGKLYVTDLESSNGLFINGKVQKSYRMVQLHENDIIGIGCADTEPDDPASFVYKVCIIKPNSPVEIVDTSILSSTIINCNTTQRESTSDAENVSEKSCEISTINCDMAMPSKIPSYTINNHKHSVNPSEEINSNISNNKQSPCNTMNNSVKTESNMVNNIKMENDIEIIHTFKTETKNQDIKPCDHSAKCLEDSNKSDSNDKTFQHSKNLYKNCKNSKKKNFSIHEDDKSSINKNSNDKNYTTENISNNQNSTPSCSKQSYLMYTNDKIIKSEDELQITDDDEEAHNFLTAASNKTTSDMMPIKLKKIKQEPKTRFSEIDVVDLSDDEDGIFPYSQLFDIKFEDDTKNKIKQEIKQENISSDTEKGLSDADDEIIILTDEDEDEDNPWLHRLSRSQIINEDEEPDMCNVIIKEEIDLGIWEDDDVSHIIWSDAPSTSKDAYKTPQAVNIERPSTSKDANKIPQAVNIERPSTSKDANKTPQAVNIERPSTSKDANKTPQAVNIKTAQASICKETSAEPCISTNDKTKYKDTRSTNNISSLLTKTNAMDIDDIRSSNEPTSKNADCNKSKKDIKLDKQTEESNEILSRISSKQRLATTKSITNKRLVPVIEAPYLPPKRSRLNKNLTKDKDTDNKVSKSPEEKSSKSRENKVLKLKEKFDDHFYSKEQKQVDDDLPPNKLKGTSISNEEKKMIMEERKQRLKKIAEEEELKKKLSAENNPIIKRTNKPRAKVTLKNRGDFLINEQETQVSKRVSDKSTEKAKSSDNQSKSRMDKANISVNSVTSSVETKMYQKENISKDIVNNVAASLQQSLYMDDIPNTIEMSNKDDSIKDPRMTNNIEKKQQKRSSSKGKKRNNENSVVDMNTKVSKLQETSSERISILAQKNNLPKIMKSKIKLTTELKKKSVSFSDNVEMKEYEIEKHNTLKKLDGKDAPMPTGKVVKKNSTRVERIPKLEEFLFRIFMWNPVWLEEQRYLRSEPPIVSDADLQPLKIRYDSFQQYYKIALPLLLLEVWHGMTKDFEDVEKNMQRATVMCSIVANSITCIPIPTTDSFLTTLLVEVLVKEEDVRNQTHPKYGDLVSFEYVKNMHDKKQMFHKVFAYITHMHQTVITDFTHYNRELRNYVNNPCAVITYTMQTRPLEHDIPVNRIQRIRTITYLRANMRMVQAIQYLPQSPLLNLILNPKVEDYKLPLINNSYTCSSLVTKDKLNPKQLEAVFKVTEAVLKKEAKLCFIQGPPGTGKSKVIVNLVTQILYGETELKNKSFKILVCAPSNAAIDEIVTRLISIRSNLNTKERFNMVRIGRTENMHSSAKNVSVSYLAKRYVKTIAERGVYLAGLREEKAKLEEQISSLNNELAKAPEMSDAKKALKRKLLDATMRYELMSSGKLIDQLNPKECAKYQRNAEDTILSGADIIACTLSSCYTNQMESIFGANKQKLSVCIVDEATQSCEAETLIPLLLGINTLVLVGDPNQLPATVLSQKAKKLGLDQSIFSRMQTAFASQVNNPIIMLDTQYRMPYSISYWPNKYFYKGKLKNATETNLTFPFHPYVILNHSSAQNNDKFSNTIEAEFVANIIYTMLLYAKWENINKPITIGVLTPYHNQKTIVEHKIVERIKNVPDDEKKINYEVNTVDSFQGQERDVIIMSCVRSHGIGFLSDKQRLCVALTRAKQSLILCGNFTTFMRDQMWKALLCDAESRGALCNVDASAKIANIKQYIVK